MKVLISVPSLEISGGVANYYSTLKPYFDSDIRYFEIGSRASERGSLAKARRLISDYWRFHRQLARDDFDLVHLNPSLLGASVIREGIFILIAKLHQRRVLVFFRGWDGLCEKTIRKYFRWLFGRVYGLVDAFIVLGTIFEHGLRSFGVKAPIFLDTTVVEDEIFEKELEREVEPDDQSRILNVLFLSRLDHGKGLIESIKAFALLQDSVPNCSMTIAGDGPVEACAQRLVLERALANVSFLGYVSGREKRRAYSRADIFLFPSCFGEGMPNTVLEAMAYGLPVITRAVGGLPDFFENERMGFMTQSRDPREFANLLEVLALDSTLRRRIGNYNRSFARERFAASKVIERLSRIYVQVR